MARKSMKDALGATLKAEEQAVQNRFERAEAVLSERESKATKPRPSKRVEKPPEPVIERVIRDSFTLPTTDYLLIAKLKQRCLSAGVNVSKSETIRAGLKALDEMPDSALLKVIERLTKIKTGRPTRNSIDS